MPAYAACAVCGAADGSRCRILYVRAHLDTSLVSKRTTLALYFIPRPISSNLLTILIDRALTSLYCVLIYTTPPLWLGTVGVREL